MTLKDGSKDVSLNYLVRAVWRESFDTGKLLCDGTLELRRSSNVDPETKRSNVSLGCVLFFGESLKLSKWGT